MSEIVFLFLREKVLEQMLKKYPLFLGQSKIYPRPIVAKIHQQTKTVSTDEITQNSLSLLSSPQPCIHLFVLLNLLLSSECWRTSSFFFVRHSCPITFKLRVSTLSSYLVQILRLISVLNTCPTREIQSLLFVPSCCTLLPEWPCLHCDSSKKKTGAVKLKLRWHNSTNYKHTWAKDIVIIFDLPIYSEMSNNDVNYNPISVPGTR